MSDAERRRAPRIERGLMVRYRHVRKTKSAWSLTPLRDLSCTGARFKCERAFEAGEILELLILLPMSEEPVALTARVAWHKPSGVVVEHGVMFDAVDPVVQQMLKKAVDYFVSKQKESE